MNYSLRTQLKELAIVFIVTAFIAAGLVALLFTSVVPTYANIPLSLSEGALNWAFVPMASFLTASGRLATFCLMFALTFLAGVALRMFPPGPRIIRVHN